MTIRNLFVTTFLSLLFPLCLLSQTNYTLINDATALPGCHCYQLTPDQGNQGGGVYQDNTINLNNSFDYKFNIFLGCNGGSGHSADGICFVLTNNITQIGAQGGGLGYQGLPGNSLAVEYDTWQNGWDPNDHHIALESGGSVQHNVVAPVTTAIPTMADCAWHTTEIIWNANTQTYTVYFDGTLMFSYTGNIVANYFAGNPIVNWGWSGSTGGGYNTQQFCIQSISSWIAGVNYQSCTLNMQLTDVSTSNVASVQSWAWNFGDPSTGANNTSSLQNPTHTFSSDGTYTVTLIITDISGCADTFSHIVTIDPPITLAPTLTDPLCNGSVNGSIDVVPSGGFGVSGGFGGYAYTWSNGISGSPNLNGLTAGTYDVTVTDGVCTTTATYTLNQPTAITATTSHTDATCGANNGSVTIVSITGGTPPYTNVTWDGVPGYTYSGLAIGTYVANFVDANGCSSLLTYRETVSQLPCGYTLSTSSTNVSCFGGSNGSVTLTVTGGTAPITITWTNGVGTTVGTGATVSGLPAGIYTYTYTDGVPTTLTGTVVVNQPGGAIAVSLSVISTTCSYTNNGSAVASITANGTPGYTYSWSAVGQPNSPTATGLSPGPISVTVTDANSCTATASGTILGHTPVAPTVVTIPDSCYGDSTGKSYVNVAGGTPGYTYLWSTGPTGIGDTLYRLPTGPYTVTVTDNNGCTGTATGTVVQPALLTATMADSNVTCFGNGNGTATVTPAGGNGGYTYVWSGSSSVIASVSGLAPNTYYVTVTDSKLCSVIDSVTITQPTLLAPFIVTLDSVSCFLGTNGGVTVNALGGSPPYTYALDGSGTFGPSGTFTGLASGPHTVTVQDTHFCDSIISFSIYQPTLLIPAIDVTRNESCFQSCDGAISVIASGGTLPYTFSLDGITYSPVDSFTSLCQGYDTIRVQDANGCIQTIIDSITQPTLLTLAVTDTIDPLCFGGTDGHIAVAAGGGTLPYTYTLDGGTAQATDSFTTVGTGTHTVTVTDNHGCTTSVTLFLAQPTQVLTTATIINDTCYGYTDGSIALTTTGGFGPYTYSWPQLPGNSANSATSLGAGGYSTTITDAHGCPETITDTVYQPAQPVLTIMPPDTILSHGDTIHLVPVFGPSSLGVPLTYLWTDTNATLSCLTCPNPVMSSTDTLNTYWLVITYNNNFCADSAYRTIRVGQLDTFAMADAFSPNGDGLNDLYFVPVSNIAGVRSFHVDIFDRWGMLVYTSNDVTQGWDGTYKGTPQPQGVYVVFFSIEYGQYQIRSASRTTTVTLFR
jgi:gliding motility-associated-like protein